MGYKTVTFTNEVEQRTYVQGEFVGKYFGTINHQASANNFEAYDIKIYDGEISNLKNEKQHSEIINETIYNAIVSETQLVQKSFEKVLVNLDSTIKDFDSIRLAIKEPKLEAVKIYDVVKDNNQTFGTLICIVSGYLLETHMEESIMQVETCNGCNEFLEDCKCKESVLVTSDEPLNEPHVPEVEKSFFDNFSSLWSEEYINWRWFAVKPFSFGCLGLLGLLIGILFLISFGFPGILIGAIVLLLYFIGSLSRIFPRLSFRWRRLLYVFLGLLFVGLLFNLFEPFYKNYRSGIDSQVKKTEPQNVGNQKNADYPKSTPPIPTSHESNSGTEDTVTGVSNENFQPQNGEANILMQENNTLEIDSLLEGNFETLNNQANKTAQLDSENSDDILNSQAQQNITSQTLTENPVDVLNSATEENPISQFEESIDSSKSNREIQIELSNNSSDIERREQQKTISQTSNESQNSIVKRPAKLKKTTEIMAGIEFQEGEVFICKGDSSKRYHFDPACAGLSNCSTQIYQINIPVAQREGRTECKLEE